MVMQVNLVMRKQMAANQALKIKLGESNFADRLTCFVFGSIVFENIVSYALVSGTWTFYSLIKINQTDILKNI